MARRLEVTAVAAAVLISLLGTAVAMAIAPELTARHVAVGLANGDFLPVLCAALGAFIVLRRPGNTIGRLLAAAGAFFALLFVVDAVAVVAETSPEAVPGWIALPLDWIWMPGAMIVVWLVPLLFPDGTVPSPRWRPIVWLTLGLFAMGALSVIVAPGPMWPVPEENPFGIESLAPVLPVAELVLLVGMVALLAVVVASVVIRYRRSPSMHRQQMKILLFPLPLIVVLVVVGTFVPGLGWLLAAGPLIIALVPIAIAVAVLRYGLYEIDRIISRTVVYATLIALLAGVYTGAVFVLSSVLAPLGGGNELAVAVATLIAVAVLRPARHRVQRMVERRFNRVRYDAARAAEAFSTEMRHIVQVDDVSQALLQTVQRTVSPVTAGLWLHDRR